MAARISSICCITWDFQRVKLKQSDTKISFSWTYLLLTVHQLRDSCNLLLRMQTSTPTLLMIITLFTPWETLSVLPQPSTSKGVHQCQGSRKKYMQMLMTLLKPALRTYKKPDTPGLQHVIIRGLSLSPEETSRSRTTTMKPNSLWMAGCSMEMVPRPSCTSLMHRTTQNSGEYKVISDDAHHLSTVTQQKASVSHAALLFAVDECKKNNRASCIVTFDRPLESLRHCC